MSIFRFCDKHRTSTKRELLAITSKCQLAPHAIGNLHTFRVGMFGHPFTGTMIVAQSKHWYAKHPIRLQTHNPEVLCIRVFEGQFQRWSFWCCLFHNDDASINHIVSIYYIIHRTYSATSLHPQPPPRTPRPLRGSAFGSGYSCAIPAPHGHTPSSHPPSPHQQNQP